MNNIAIHGRLTRDPEVKTYKNSKGESGSVTKFTVAVDRQFGEETDFFDCVAFGKLAEVIDKHMEKGREIVVLGSMECNPYKANDGTKRYPWSLRVSSFDFCGSKKSNSNESADPGDTFEQIDDDVPF